MTECIICGQKTGAFSKKAYRGKVCKSCLSFIPKSIKLATAETDWLKGICEKNMSKKEVFSPTASYGALYIDSVHNMFCISKRSRGGEPAEFCDIYHVSELTEVGLYCTDVKNVGTRTNKVVCNVKFKIATNEVLAEYLVVGNEPCPFERQGGKLTCGEPNKLSVFRSMFNQMIDNEVFNLAKKLEMIQQLQSEVSKAEGSEVWARGVFFFDKDEEITADTVKERRNMLVKAFHPDRNSDVADTEITAYINRAYKVLRKE